MDLILIIIWEVIIVLFLIYLYLTAKKNALSLQFQNLGLTSFLVKNGSFYLFLLIVPFLEKFFINIADALKINGLLLMLLVVVLIMHFLILKLSLKSLILEAKIKEIDQKVALNTRKEK